MSSYTDAYTIKCWDDCRMEGCPGHDVKIVANNTSNVLVYEKDSKGFGMDFDELDAFIKSVANMRGWVEIDRTFKEVEQDRSDNDS